MLSSRFRLTEGLMDSVADSECEGGLNIPFDDAMARLRVQSGGLKVACRDTRDREASEVQARG